MKQVDDYRQIPLKYYEFHGKKIEDSSRSNRNINSYFSGTYAMRIIRRGLRFWLMLALAAVIAPARAFSADIPATQTAPLDASAQAKIDGLIRALSADDAFQRDDAARKLVAMGAPARAAVLQATHSDDPELRDQASQILLKLPWYIDADPPEVRAILEKYGQVRDETGQNVVDATPDDRKAAIRALFSLQKFEGFNAMQRLMSEDPSASVRWFLVGAFRESNNDKLLAYFRTIDPAADDAPMLTLCGNAWLDMDAPKAQKMLQQAANLEFAKPSDDSGQVDELVRTLAELDILQKNPDGAADLWRKEYTRGSEIDATGVPTALTELLVLQANHGPLPGLDGDLKLAGDAANSPEIGYALARISKAKGDAAEADSLRQKAFNGSTTREQRSDVGDFLFLHDWNDEAEKEFNAYLKMPPTNNGDPVDVNVYFRLSGLAQRRGDDLQAAQLEEKAMLQLSDQNNLVTTDAEGHHIPTAASDIWSEIYWLYLRDANTKHDQAEVDMRLAQLLQNKPTNPEIASYVVPLLKKLNRPDDARTIFNAAFDDLKKKLDDDPTNPMLLNNIAWFCAESEENMEQGKKWADEAVAAKPDNAAFLDTLAELNFKLGDAAKAIELETHALTLEPGDKFMSAQLARFKGITTQPATMP
jgi:tetratricopeptide (TPR) repeat protein